MVYDRRGHGCSDREPQATRRDHEDDLAALIEGLGIGPATVVGTSFGGSIAIGLATRRPALLRNLIVHEPPLIGLIAGDPELQPELERVQAGMSTVLALLERGDALGAARRFVDELAFEPGAWEQLPEPLRDTMIDAAPTLLAEQNDPLWASVDGLGAIDCPVLLTQGGESPSWFAPIVAKLAGAIVHARVHTFTDAGHAPHLTHPDDYLATLVPSLAALLTVRVP